MFKYTRKYKNSKGNWVYIYGDRSTQRKARQAARLDRVSQKTYDRVSGKLEEAQARLRNAATDEEIAAARKDVDKYAKRRINAGKDAVKRWSKLRELELANDRIQKAARKGKYYATTIGVMDE